jgi:hypothetical protein
MGRRKGQSRQPHKDAAVIAFFAHCWRKQKHSDAIWSGLGLGPLRELRELREFLCMLELAHFQVREFAHGGYGGCVWRALFRAHPWWFARVPNTRERVDWRP